MGLKDYFTNRRLNKLERDLRMIQNKYNFDASKAIDLSNIYSVDAFTKKVQEYQVWKTGDSTIINYFYKHFGSITGGINELNYFWQKAKPNMIKRHTGIPKMICNKFGTILFGSDFKINAVVYKNKDTVNELASEQASDMIRALTDKCKLIEKFKDMAIKESWCGHSFIKFNYDLSLSQYPIVETYDLTQAEAVVERGITKAIVFKSYFTKQEKNKQVKKYRFDETYTTDNNGDALIINELFVLTADGKEDKVELTAIPETESLQDEYHFVGLKGMLAFHKPNKLPNNLFSYSPYGSSDFEGAIDSFDALDEIYSELAYETRNNKTIRFIPSTMIPAEEDGEDIQDMMSFVTAFQMVEGSFDQNAKNELIVQQIPDKTLSLAEKFKSTLVTAINNAGLSPLALGITGLEAINSGETSQRERNRVTLETRKEKINTYWIPFLKEFLTQLVAFNNWLIKTAGAKQLESINNELNFETVDLTFDFGNYVVENESEVITRWVTAKSGQVASVETAVREIHPEWTEDQILSEVTKIKYENNLGMDDPTLLQMDMVNEEPIEEVVNEDNEEVDNGEDSE